MVKPTPSNSIVDYTWPGCSEGNAGVFVFVIPPVWLSTCSVMLSTCSVLKMEREEGVGLLQLRSLLSRIFLSQHSHRTDALLCVSAVVSQFYLMCASTEMLEMFLGRLILNLNAR